MGLYFSATIMTASNQMLYVYIIYMNIPIKNELFSFLSLLLILAYMQIVKATKILPKGKKQQQQKAEINLPLFSHLALYYQALLSWQENRRNMKRCSNRLFLTVVVQTASGSSSITRDRPKSDTLQTRLLLTRILRAARSL